jgi:hypothetical protein
VGSNATANTICGTGGSICQNGADRTTRLCMAVQGAPRRTTRFVTDPPQQRLRRRDGRPTRRALLYGARCPPLRSGRLCSGVLYGRIAWRFPKRRKSRIAILLLLNISPLVLQPADLRVSLAGQRAGGLGSAMPAAYLSHLTTPPLHSPQLCSGPCDTPRRRSTGREPSRRLPRGWDGRGHERSSTVQHTLLLLV